MANHIKGQEEILQKLGITQLNPMQEEAIATIKKKCKYHSTIPNRNR